MTQRFDAMLDRITRVRNVRGAILVASDDGVVVADRLMEGVKGNAVAALAASLMKRLGQATEVAGVGHPQFLHLQSENGVLLAAPATREMLLVTVADVGVNIGLVRLEMLRTAEAVA